MQDYYGQIRALHLGAVAASVGLFFVRGLLLNAMGQTWVMAPPLRYASYAIDTVLLAAGLGLMVVVRQYPGVDAWLTVKVVLLAVYIVLGSFALKRGKTAAARLGFWLGALLVVAFIYSVARAHDPRGIFAALA